MIETVYCFVTFCSLHRVYIKDDNLRTQPKFIVFLSQLLLLFRFCHFCKAENPLVETRQVGTMAVVTWRPVQTRSAAKRMSFGRVSPTCQEPKYLLETFCCAWQYCYLAAQHQKCCSCSSTWEWLVFPWTHSSDTNV